MIKYITLFILTAITSANMLHAQKLEVGVEGGLSFARYRINDPHNNIKKVPAVSGLGGVNVRRNFKNFFTEAAFLAKEYAFGIRLSNEVGYTTTNAHEVFLLPLRAGKYFHLSPKIAFVPVVGITHGYVFFDSQSSMSAAFGSTGLTNYYVYNERLLHSRFFLLLQGGAGLEFKIAKPLVFSIGANYYHGLTKISTFDVEYKMENEPVRNAEVYSYGSFWNINGGFKYQIKNKR